MGTTMHHLHHRLGAILVAMLVLMGQAPAPEPPSPDEAPAVQPPEPVQDAPAPVAEPDQVPEEAGAAPDAPVSTTAAPSTAGPVNHVAVIRIEGMIYDFTLESLRRRAEKAKAVGADIIVLEINTKGGVATSGMDIAKYIKGGQIGLPTIAWINQEAYSAGILIASATKEMIMAPGSAMGDCAPIVPGQELAPTERAKALSPLLEEFRSNAKQNPEDYSYAVFHAMCELGVEVYHIEHKQTGERRLVDQVDYAYMVGGRQASPGGLIPRLFGSTPDPSPASATASELPPQLAMGSTFTEEDRGQWTLIRQVHDGKTLLTLYEDRAYEIGLVRAKDIANDSDLKAYLNAQQITRIAPTWSENIAGWLTTPWMRGILIVLVLIGAYLEFQSPGLGLPGAVAVIALMALLGAPYLVGLAEIWPVLLFLVGVILLLVELFVIPGFGVIGFAGLGCMFVGLVMQVVPLGGGIAPPPGAVAQLQRSLFWTMLGFLVAVGGFVALIMHFGKIPGINRLVLADVQRPALGGLPEPVDGDEVLGEGGIQIGDTGVVVSDLRPTGRAQIEGDIVDVVSTGEWIEPGRQVKVVEVHGNRIVVEPAGE